MTDTIARMVMRQGSKAAAESANEVLLQGEFFYETDTGRIKVGDGDTQYKKIISFSEEAAIAIMLEQGIYTGCNLSEKFAAEIANYSSTAAWLHARCAAGNFAGIHPFDYWYEATSAATIAGTSVPAQNRKCVIAGINLYKGTGDTELTSNHLVIWAGLSDMNVTFNDVNSNNGSTYNASPVLASKAWAVLNGVNNVGTNKTGSVGYNANGAGFLQTFSSALQGYMKNMRCFMGERYSSTAAVTNDTGQNWKDRGKLFLPSEIEVYGCMIHSNNTAQTYGNQEGYGPYCHWPIFKSAGTNGRLREGRAAWWLGSVVGGSSSRVCVVSGGGVADSIDATGALRRLPLCFILA